MSLCPDKPNVFWWEIPCLLRRSVVVALDVLLYAFPFYKLVSFMCVNMIVFCAHTWLRPFRESRDNTMESISLFVLLILSAVLAADNQSQELTVSMLIFVLAGGPTILFLLLIIISRTHKIANVIMKIESPCALCFRQCKCDRPPCWLRSLGEPSPPAVLRRLAVEQPGLDNRQRRWFSGAGVARRRKTKRVARSWLAAEQGGS